MSRQFGKLSVFLSIIASCACLTASAQAKTVKFTARCTGNLVSATVIKGSCATTLGHASFVDQRSGAKFSEVLKFAHGTMTVNESAHLTGRGDLAGTFKVTGGTGAYRHASGRGTGSATPGPPAKSTLAGKVSY